MFKYVFNPRQSKKQSKGNPAINGNQWQSMAIRQSMAIHGNLWQSMAINLIRDGIDSRCRIMYRHDPWVSNNNVPALAVGRIFSFLCVYVHLGHLQTVYLV
jgi:hypothetical protein